MNILRFHQKALADVEVSYKYYQEQSDGLGERFITEIDKVINQIQKYPLRARIIKDKYRVVNTCIFPFQVIYTYNKKLNRISVTAVHHASRHPKKRFRKF